MTFNFNISQALSIINGIKNAITVVFDTYVALLFNFLYTIFLVLTFVLDFIQVLFRKLVGLESYSINGQTQTGDIAGSLINDPSVQNVFWSLLILGGILLFVSTFVAVIKSEYQPLDAKAGNNKGKVVAKSLRAALMMGTVPIVAILGLFISNALLRTFDLATSKGGGNLSGRVFSVAAYEANRARISSPSYSSTFKNSLNNVNHFGLFNEGSSSGFIEETVADKIDRAFQDRTAVTSTTHTVDFTAYHGATSVQDRIYENLFNNLGHPDYPEEFSIYNYKLVWFYYDLRHFNFFIGIGIALFLSGVLLKTMLGLIKRIYAIAVLFIVAPPIIAVSPISDTPFKAWQKEFVGSILSAYSIIVVMNLFLMLIPVLGRINFFVPEPGSTELARSSVEYFNRFAHLLIILGGGIFFKDFSATLSRILAADDTLKAGADNTKPFMGALSRGTALSTGLATAPITATAAGIRGVSKIAEPIIDVGRNTKKATADSYREYRDQGHNWINAAALAGRTGVATGIRDTAALPVKAGKGVVGGIRNLAGSTSRNIKGFMSNPQGYLKNVKEGVRANPSTSRIVDGLGAGRYFSGADKGKGGGGAAGAHSKAPGGQNFARSPQMAIEAFSKNQMKDFDRQIKKEQRDLRRFERDGATTTMHYAQATSRKAELENQKASLDNQTKNIAKLVEEGIELEFLAKSKEQKTNEEMEKYAQQIKSYKGDVDELQSTADNILRFLRSNQK